MRYSTSTSLSNRAIPLALTLVLFIFSKGYSQPSSSILATGKWYKISISKDGVYKISASAFKSMGFDLSKTDPRNVKVYGNPGGMLPQANSSYRPEDLTEIAILVAGESDGVFNTDDYISFYATGPDAYSLNSQNGILTYEKNLYADRNFYFVTVGTTAGKRIAKSSSPGTGLAEVSEHDAFVYHESESFNLLKSGREWYGEKFDATLDYSFNKSVNNVIPGSQIKFVSRVMAQSTANTTFRLSVNGINLIDQFLFQIPNIPYGVKGTIASDTLMFPESSVSASSKNIMDIGYQYQKNPSIRGIGFLDRFLIQYKRNLVTDGTQLIFQSLKSLDNPASKFSISQTSVTTKAWDITDPTQPIEQSVSYNAGSNQSTFSALSATLRRYIVFSAEENSFEKVGPVLNQNLRQLETPDLLIITHSSLLSEVRKLADHKAQMGISSAVITVDQVYNEFSSGRQDVTAIRDFVKNLYDKNPGRLKNLLLFGKGSYDPKTRIVDNINLVPFYESRNSLHPLETYNSDDYYGFLESHEGDWIESNSGNHTLDIGVGRIPARNIEEAKNVVDKIIRYETDRTARSPWQKKIVLIADDGDINRHTSDAEQLAALINQEFDIQKIYLDQYEQVSRPAGEISPAATEAVSKAIKDGALVINYTGHGGERILAQERLFDDFVITKLDNTRLPLMVTATCEFGRMDDPILISGAELSLLKQTGGTIGLVSTGRPVDANKNIIVNTAFYQAFFQRESGKPLPLGEIFRRTKNNSVSGVSNRNFSLIGDPSLQLLIPEYSITTTQITTKSGSPVLGALSEVTITGEVQKDGQLESAFNGVVNVTLYDKETDFRTLGSENPPFDYKAWFNIIFRGKASVSSGRFEITFVIPKNIAYQVAPGKLSLYAYDNNQTFEGIGYSQDFEIGNSDPAPGHDQTSPIVNAYMGDATFVNGGITSSNTNLFVILEDQNGINVSGYGIGNSITGILDNDITFNLNEYYSADLDNFRKGTINYPLKELAPGRHTITVKAWDTFNNPSQSTVNFSVTKGEQLTINAFTATPNPFTRSTALGFTHNRSGEDLMIEIGIYDQLGKLLITDIQTIISSPYETELSNPEIESAIERLPAGLFLARIKVRSSIDGTTVEKVLKLIKQ